MALLLLAGAAYSNLSYANTLPTTANPTPTSNTAGNYNVEGCLTGVFQMNAQINEYRSIMSGNNVDIYMLSGPVIRINNTCSAIGIGAAAGKGNTKFQLTWPLGNWGGKNLQATTYANQV